ncbi:uncharacterized protein LACBIDRAFT_308007 [Laccaria bicolor S238N-H82]|uniref:Predicted protein n=1 Tax=Laccaria bicolor (strain S238N-H82 / ATCC MYA-4686) TaxID=486041 RepID=B0DRE5_LACBS|nr:uncharacterized protein LACBIDRAFT_308007 [Laccaria bicolor S238N-H82]EDR02771.1 predicted protein [Laccaria bicolor S238N-H82]|eukprot:XP_001886481.1 predicted protein [Laccaria bicolor S238N-H82]
MTMITICTMLPLSQAAFCKLRCHVTDGEVARQQMTTDGHCSMSSISQPYTSPGATLAIR